MGVGREGEEGETSERLTTTRGKTQPRRTITPSIIV